MIIPGAGAARRALTALAAGVTCVLAVPATSSGAPVRGLPEGLCPQDPPDASFLDREEIASYHLDAVDCLHLLDIARGYGNDQGNLYMPRQDVRRDEMAAFVARTLTVAGVDLPAPTEEPFSDVSDGNPHADAIRQLAQVDVVRGVGGGRYEPDGAVDRDEMATFLVRAAALEAGVEHEDLQGGETPFTDVSTGIVHWPDIEGAFELGITNGTGPGRYSPARSVTREEMASFLSRTLDAMTQRTTVADRDAGALSHTVYTFGSEQGRCFQVKAGEAWVTQCDPATNATLQLWQVRVDDGFEVVVGLASPTVTSVMVETTGSEPVEAELTPVEGAYQAFSSPILADGITSVVAYAGSNEVAREVPDVAPGLPFPADTQPDFGEGHGEPVVLTDVRTGHHEGFDRLVLDVGGGGNAGWNARYVNQAVEQGRGNTVDVAGDAILEISMTNMAYPTESDVQAYPQGRVDGVHAVTEVHVGTTFEGITQLFVGLDARVPFRVFALEEPSRVVVDVVHP